MSMAIKYAMNKRQKMAQGGMPEGEKDGCVPCKDGMCTAHGGMVDRIMSKRMSNGGMVSNDTPPVADDEPADYDVLATDDDLSFHETEANSGDDDGDYATDNPVDRIMMKRKKDRNPRPV